MPVFRRTSDTVASQLFRFQERVEEVGERRQGKNQPEDVLEGHGHPQISSHRFAYQSEPARRATVVRRKTTSSIGVLSAPVRNRGRQVPPSGRWSPVAQEIRKES